MHFFLFLEHELIAHTMTLSLLAGASGTKCSNTGKLEPGLRHNMLDNALLLIN